VISPPEVNSWEKVKKYLPINPPSSEKLKSRYTALQKAAILTIIIIIISNNNNNNNNNNNRWLRFEDIKTEAGSKIVAAQDQAAGTNSLKIKV
jgi:hypothetical protein